MGAFWRRWGHLIVLALVLPLALSSALPTFARVLGGPVPHICHCMVSGGHSTCGCPICNPDRDDLKLREASIRGECGDKDVAYGGALGVAIPAPAVVTVLPAPLARTSATSPPTRRSDVFLTPPTRPPRTSVS